MVNFRSMDYFRKINSDIETSTACGGVYSIVALVLGVVLFYTEIRLYSSRELVREMTIENDMTRQTIRLNLNFTLYHSPCLSLSLCQEDDVGTHIVDVQDTIVKTRISKDGFIINEKQGAGNSNYAGSQQELDDLIASINNGEQCMISGHLMVNKIPGNFHISFHAKRGLVQRLKRVNPTLYNKLKLDNKLNHLSFGDIDGYNKIFSNLFGRELPFTFNPYDGTDYRDSENLVEQKNYNFFIKIVPNNFIDHSRNLNLAAYQFSMNNREAKLKSHDDVPAIFVNFEVSPITEVYSYKNHNFLHFLVQVCAIVGGLFSVIGILNSITNESYRIIKKPEGMPLN